MKAWQTRLVVLMGVLAGAYWFLNERFGIRVGDRNVGLEPWFRWLTGHSWTYNGQVYYPPLDIDNGLISLRWRGPWAYFAGFCLMVYFAWWVGRRPRIRMWMFPVLVFVGPFVGGREWFEWVVVVGIVYAIARNKPAAVVVGSKQLSAEQRANLDAFPWYWRLSSALVWAVLLFTIGRALILGGIDVSQLLPMAPFAGLAFGFLFKPTVELFGRSIDTLLAAASWLGGTFGVSAVEGFQKRAFSNRLWAIAPFAVVGALALFTAPLIRSVSGSYAASLSTKMMPTAVVAGPTQRYRPMARLEKNGCVVTVPEVALEPDRLAITVRWEVRRPIATLYGPSSSTPDFLSAGRKSLRRVSDDGRVQGQIRLTKGKPVEGTFYFPRPRDPFVPYVLGIYMWSGAASDSVATPPESIAFDLTEKAP